MRREELSGIGAVLAVLLVDQATKAWAWGTLLARPWVAGGGGVRLFVARNGGLWSGWLSGSELARPVASMLAGMAVCGAIILHRKAAPLPDRARMRIAAALGVVVGAVLSNLADRFVARCEATTPIARLGFHQLVANAGEVASALHTGKSHVAPCAEGVVDFISLHGPGGVRTPVFNLADLLLTCGLLLLIGPISYLARSSRDTQVQHPDLA